MAHPFIPAPNTALVEMVYTAAGVIIENTFHVTGSVPFTALTLQGLCNTFDSWDNAASGGKAVRGNTSLLVLIRARALDTASAPFYNFPLPVARAGTLAATPMPNNLTFAVKLETGLSGRSYRGRIYIPTITSAVLQASPNQNLVAAVYASSCVTAYNLLITSISAAVASNHLVVASYRSGGAWRSTAVCTTITNAAFADLRVDTQRRRLR